MQRRVTVFFRFDDYSETSPAVVEAGLVAALTKQRVCATFAVIPAVTEGKYHEPGDRGTRPLGPEKARFLREAIAAGAVDVALHGWNHRTHSPRSPHSEFVGLSAEEQRSRIRNGRELLRRSLGVNASVFVPPWNRYDDTTLEALTEQGFTCVSANRYGRSRPGALRFLPTTADLREIRQAVAVARESRDPNPIVGVLLHPYDFADSGDPRGDVTCEAFEADLAWLRGQPDVDVLPISHLAKETPGLDCSRYRANQPLPYESAFPPFVQTTFATPFFMSEREARRTKRIRALSTVGTYIAAAILGWGLEEMLRTGPTGSMVFVTVNRGRWVLAGMVALLVARVLWRREVYFRAMLALALLSGMLLGALR
jgi:peptidoglycan/xylan/chitin deacetylase (PgdA/CDA1 family)